MRRIGRGLLVAALFAVLAPGAASATTPTVVPPATSGSQPPPKPAHATLKLYLARSFRVNGQPVTVADRGVLVSGLAGPFVPGQWVTVRAFTGQRQVYFNRFRLKRSPRGVFGRFTTRIVSPRSGRVRVYVFHASTPGLQSMSARTSFAALDQNIGFGSVGPFVDLIQQRLAALHFYIPQTGVYDAGMGLAIDAYHRLLGWGSSQNLDGATVNYLLNGWGVFPVRYAGDGTHVEGNLTHQLLALINGSHVYQIYPISSGKPSTPTILGHFNVYSRVPGYLPDGMYFSSFFSGGYAIHGYDPAPDYPASHGCMRLPIADAIPVYNWLNYGDSVDVYY